MSVLEEGLRNIDAAPGFQCSYISTGNSTVTPLSGDATFTGEAEKTAHTDMLVYCYSDVAGTLYIDLGIVKGNYRTSIPFSCSAGASEFHTVVKGYRWCRVRYVNGSGAQSVFELQTEFGVYRQANKGLQVALGRDDDAAAVRGSDFYQEVQEGRRAGYSILTKFGLNSDVTAAEDIWGGGGTYTGQPVSFTPETVNVFSSNDEDGGAGTDTGALTLRISGLKTSTSTAYESEDITLNGTTAVTSANTWWRVNRAYVLTAGSAGGNLGTLTIRSTTTTANVFAVMPIGANQTQIAAWTAPSGQTAWLKRVRIAVSRANAGTGTANVSIRVREPGGVYRAIRIFQMTTSGPVQYQALGGAQILAGSDIKVRADAVSGASLIEASLEMLVVED